MLKPTLEEFRDMLQSAMIGGELVRGVTYTRMVRKPFTIFHLELPDNKWFDIAFPNMHLDARKDRNERN